MAFNHWRAARRERRMRRLGDVGVRAPAVITRVADTGRDVDGFPAVEITYAVEPADRPGFDITKVTPVSVQAVPRPGLPALAVFDPAHPLKDNVVIGGDGHPGRAADSPYEIEVAFNRTLGLGDRPPSLTPEAQHSSLTNLRAIQP